MDPTRIQFRTVRQSHKVALQRGKAHLQRLLQLSVPDEWPYFPEAFEPAGEESPTVDLWPSYFIICPREKHLIGNGGFAGSPNAAGEVEVGYEIAPQFRNRGFATAAVGRMLRYAFSKAEVKAVIAHTLAVDSASTAVLRKAGMRFVAEVPDADAGALWRWRITRAGRRSASP